MILLEQCDIVRVMWYYFNFVTIHSFGTIYSLVFIYSLIPETGVTWLRKEVSHSHSAADILEFLNPPLNGLKWKRYSLTPFVSLCNRSIFCEKYFVFESKTISIGLLNLKLFLLVYWIWNYFYWFIESVTISIGVLNL